MERQNERSKLVLRNTYEAVILSILFQSGITLLALGSGYSGAKPLGKALLGISAFLAARVPFNISKVRKLDKYNERYGMKT